jgi:TolA-binding protein
MSAVTYSNAAVQKAFAGEDLQLVKVPIHEQPGDAARFKVRWTPTFIWFNHRGDEVYRTVGFIPPEDFLALQAFGRAQAAIYDGDFDLAAATLRQGLSDHPESIFAPQLVYWRGVAEFNATRDRDLLIGSWAELREKWPESEWTMRTP